MSISVVCKCGAKLTAKESMAGKKVKCPKCTEPLSIPTPPASAPAKAKETPAASSTVASLLDDLDLQPVPVSKGTGIKCPNCNDELSPGAVLCLSCGYNLQTKKQLKTSADSESHRNREEHYARQAAAADKRGFQEPTAGKAGKASGEDPLAPLDYIVCILCPGIGLIASIIYCVTGNPKGRKMLMISLVMVAVLNIIGFILRSNLPAP